MEKKDLKKEIAHLQAEVAMLQEQKWHLEEQVSTNLMFYDDLEKEHTKQSQIIRQLLQEKNQQQIDHDILEQDVLFKQKIIETLDKEIENLKKEGEKN